MAVSTTVTVASEVWSAAMRCMTVVRMRRARSLPSSAAWRSISRTRCCASACASSTICWISAWRASPAVRPLTRSSSAICRCCSATRPDLLLFDLALPLLEAGLAALERLQLVVQALRPIEQQPLLALQVGALLARLLLGGALRLEGVVLALEHDLLLLGPRLGDDPLGVALGVLDR